jgi:hypothetical protein
VTRGTHTVIPAALYVPILAASRNAPGRLVATRIGAAGDPDRFVRVEAVLARALHPAIPHGLMQSRAQVASWSFMPGAPEQADLLAGRWFQITRITEHGLDVDVALAGKPTIGFLDNNIWVATGGNHYYGAYEIDGEGRLVVHHFGGTQVRYEGGGIDAQEQRITAALVRQPAVECSDQVLVLKSEIVTLHVVEVPRPSSAAGWIIRPW